ncbi:hypothetical protein [Cupriavidus sp. DL-D2]|uniref:hypothetical protein n=1 Tax=Cupriavidus sp. DL-D2 TaxID=3144974 RepID=UPI003212FD70
MSLSQQFTAIGQTRAAGERLIADAKELEELHKLLVELHAHHNAVDRRSSEYHRQFVARIRAILGMK